MIGEPDGFYDAEERTEAYNDLQDALQGNYMDDYIKDGACPACGGSGYMDGEETFTNDDGEEEESSECDGFGNYGCDEGEMTYGSDGPSWVEIMKHDERRKERAELAAKPQPSDDVLFKAAKLLHKEYVMDTGRYNAFELPQLLRQMYPEIPKHKAREIGSQVLNDYKAENKINSDMALTTEGKKSDDAVNTLVNMFYDMLDEFSSEEELEAEVESQAQSLTRVYGDFDTQKATERALADLSDNSDYPGSIDRDYDARNEGVLEGNMTFTDFVKQAKQSQKLNVIRDKELILKAYELFSKGVANTPGDAVNMAQAHMDNMAYEGKSPHKKGTKKYKKHMAAMHAGEGITTGPTKNNVRITELSPARDNSANEQKVAELIRKSLKDPQGQDAFELYAELESTNPELAELYKDVALNQYEVNLEEGIKDTLKKGNLDSNLEEVLVPTHQVTEVKKGKRTKKEKKYFPGYVLIKVDLTKQIYHLIKNLQKVSGFLGSENKPTPITDTEIKRIMGQVSESAISQKSGISFEIGEKVKVCDGPFASFNGLVEEIDEEKSRLKVSVSIFGRPTPVDLEFNQVEKN